jgi:hypothetical protein
MKDVRIRRRTRGIVALGALGGLVAAVLAQLPEIRRYLKIKSM